MTMIADFSNVPEGWWLYGLFHQHTPIFFAGEKHRPLNLEKHGQEEWACKLQHVDGGRLAVGQGNTPNNAIRAAIQEIEIEIEIGR